MKELSGYFELELAANIEYYQNVLRLNSGRNCLEYIQRERNYRRIYLPKFSCNALLEPLRKTGVEYTFYAIDNSFEPLIPDKLGNDEALLYINYFGINDHVVRKLSASFTNLIIDNSQAFFSKPLPETDTFYSPRKFFGVPDGGYLSTNLQDTDNLAQDVSYDRSRHLLHRIDEGAFPGYQEYKNNEVLINSLPIMRMSNLTHRILCSIDYERVKKARKQNFEQLHSALVSMNLIHIDMSELGYPFIYPLLIDSGNCLREYLWHNNVYCAIYWPDTADRLNNNDFEGHLVHNLVALPIDQRLSSDDINILVNLISIYYSN